MKEKSKNSFLDYIKNHRIIRWIFFVSALIGAIFVIVSLPVKTYDFYKSVSTDQAKEIEFKKLELLKPGISTEFVKSTFGEPKRKEKCSKYHEGLEMEYSTCIFPEILVERDIFETDYYYLYTFLDKDQDILAYSVAIKDLSFNPTFEIFLGRFVGDKKIKLGVTKFSELRYVDDNFTSIIDDPVIGSNYGSYSQIIYSTDYAVKSLFILESSSLPSWLLSYNIDCPYNLAINYPPEDDLIYQKEVDSFTETCPIGSITVVDRFQIEKFYDLDQTEMINNHYTEYSANDLNNRLKEHINLFRLHPEF